MSGVQGLRIFVWPRTGPLRPVSNVGHWKYSLFKGDAGGKGRMSNKVDIFGSSATLSPDVSVFITVLFLYVGVMLTCRKLHLAVQCLLCH